MTDVKVERILRSSAIAALLIGSTTAYAANYTEVGDAGELVGTAQAATGIGSLTSITGSLAANSADMFRIYISDFSVFRATTVGGTTFDSQLYLFTASGVGIAANDDTVFNTVFQSTLPVGNALYSGLSPGEYLIAVSGYDYDPRSAGGLIFPTSPFDGIFGPTGAGGGSAVNGWGGAGAGGDYVITLSGALMIPLPPAAWAGLLGLGAVGSIGLARRRALLR